MASSVPLPISKLVGVKCRQYVFFKAFYHNGSQGHRTRFLNYWYVKDEECLNPLTAGKQDTKLGEALWKQRVNGICTSGFFTTCMFESWLNPVWVNNSLCQRVFMYVHVGGDRIRASGGPKDWCRVQEAVRLGPAGHAAALPVERSRHGSGEDAQAVRRYSWDRVDDFIFLIVNMWPLINHTIIPDLYIIVCITWLHLLKLFSHSTPGNWFTRLTNTPTKSVPTTLRSTREPPDTTTPARRNLPLWRSVMPSSNTCMLFSLLVIVSPN